MYTLNKLDSLSAVNGYNELCVAILTVADNL